MELENKSVRHIMTLGSLVLAIQLYLGANLSPCSDRSSALSYQAGLLDIKTTGGL